jgi:hypothetical protein
MPTRRVRVGEIVRKCGANGSSAPAISPTLQFALPYPTALSTLPPVRLGAKAKSRLTIGGVNLPFGAGD